MFLIKLYNKNIFKTSEQVKFLEQNLINHAILILVSNYYYLLIVCEKSYSTSSSQAPLGNLFELFELLDIESIERLVFFLFLGKKS